MSGNLARHLCTRRCSRGINMVGSSLAGSKLYCLSAHMTSILRSRMLPQSYLRPIGRRAFSVKPPVSHALSPASAIRPFTKLLLQRPTTSTFHTSSRRTILPPGPQVIEGDVNDPAPIPKPSPTHGSYHWTFERAISVGLVPLTIAPFAYGSLNPMLDAVLVGAILLHSHVGFTLVLPKNLVPCLTSILMKWKVNHYRLYPEQEASDCEETL